MSQYQQGGYAPQPGYPHQYPPQYPQGQYPPQPPYGQPPYGQPPNNQYPPQQMQYQPAPKEEKSHGCLYSCIAAMCCCWLCGETCECCLECLDCCF